MQQRGSYTDLNYEWICITLLSFPLEQILEPSPSLSFPYYQSKND
jgi:hypothetical protein